MPYAARPGARRSVAIVRVAALLSFWSALGCSDSGDGPSDSGGTGGSDGGYTDGAFTDREGGKGDAPFDSPLSQWRPIAVEGTLCRDGTQTGYAINVNASSRNLVIFMEGGGACFNPVSCLQNPDSWPPTDASIVMSLKFNWVLSRSSVDSPFKDWNLVYIPYCSGDVHTGSAMSGYMGQPQVGFLNYKKDLAQIVARFPNLDRVVLTGVSAGGFGVAWNWLYDAGGLRLGPRLRAR